MAAKKKTPGLKISQYSGHPSDPNSPGRLPFYDGRLCPAEGDLSKAWLMLVGEAPGENEIFNRDKTTGKWSPRPFVGSSGQVLDRILKGAMIPRSLCYLTNVIKERPFKNEIDIFIDLESDPPVETLAWKSYLKYLESEVKSFNGSTIVALGTTAMYALTGFHDKITKRRGSIYQCTLDPSKKVVIAVHPRYCMTQYLFEHISRQDMFKALQESRNGLPIDRPRTVFINPTFEEVIQYLNFLKTQTLISLDIELVRQEISHISFSHSLDYAMSIPFYKGGNNYFDLNQEAQIWREIASILEDEKICKMLQNGSFDWSFIFKKYGIIFKNFSVDTMVMQGLCYPDLPKDLGFICSTRTRLPYYKDEGKGDTKRWTTIKDDNSFQTYNAKDSLSLQEAYPNLYREIDRLKNMKVCQATMSLIEPAVFMMEKGIRMDIEWLKRREKEATSKIEKLDDYIRSITGNVVQNVGSKQQLKDYFYGTLKIKPYIDRNTKNPKLDENSLKRIAIQGFDIAQKVIDRTKIATMRNRYYRVKLEGDRLKCFMNVVGAIDTGRFSTSRNVLGLGTNMQTSPADFKRAMLADPGYMIFEADYKQAELVIVANIAPETSMLYEMENGLDVHKGTAERIMKFIGMDTENITKLQRRKYGKEPNFGFNYGLSAQGFSLRNMIPLKDAKQIRDGYLNARRGIEVYWNWVRKDLSINQRKLTNPFGRTRVFLDRWNEACKQAYDYFPQSTVADTMNNYGVHPTYYRDEYFHDLELLNQNHDSLVFQIPLKVGWTKMAEILLNSKWFMTQDIPPFKGRQFHLDIDIQAGLNLADVEMDEGKTLEEVGTWAKSFKLKKLNNKVEELAVELEEVWKKALALDERGLHK